MGILATIARALGAAHQRLKDPRPSPVLVFRTEESAEVKDPRHRRIIELANGVSIEEITDLIYREDLRAGGWLTDIGLWKSNTCSDLAMTIGKLTAMGFLRLEMNDRESGVKLPEPALPDEMHLRQPGSIDRENRTRVKL